MAKNEIHETKRNLKVNFTSMNWNELNPDWPLICFYAFSLMILIQASYFIFIFSRLAFHKPRTGSQNDSPLPVSVIVCARDEAANLAANLRGILVQDYPSTHEVIVVNDNSVDDSKYILAEYQRVFPQLKVIELSQEAKLIPGKKFPLSMGIKSAAHDIVLLTDADCVPATEHWISSMQSCFRGQTEIVLGYGPYHRTKGFLNKLVRWETFHSALQYLSYSLAGIPYMGVGRNLSYKKEVFFRLKGFSSHHHIPGGDDDLFINMAANKKNTAINIDKDSFTLSRPPSSWTQWFRQKQRHYSTAGHYRIKHRFLLGLYSLSHFSVFPLFAASLFYHWEYAVMLFGARWLLMGAVIYPASCKLGEKDLFSRFPIFDMLMFLYYPVFMPALFRKNKNSWK